MKIKSKKNYLSLFVGLSIIACDSGPKVIQPSDYNSESSTGIFSEAHATHEHQQHNHPVDNTLHTIVVEEVLPTSRYVYLKVREGETQYWIATGKMEVNAGETYYYQEEGLLKTNFVSKEHNRTFDELYLVSKIVPTNHGNENKTSQIQTPAVAEKIKQAEGAVKIAELVANPQKYSGKTILISAKCTKVNANIMGKNWLHMKDGSKDDYDLVVSSTVNIPEGHIVNITGKVALNKDFGAGYKYDIILEDGQLAD